MEVKGQTSTPWAVGYGDGLTGPTTPAVCGVTVAEEIQYRKWQESGNPADYPHNYHIPIRHGHDTVAIVPNLPGSNGHENAASIVEAVNHHSALVSTLDRLLRRSVRDIPAGDWCSESEPEIFAAWSLLVSIRDERILEAQEK